MVTAMVPFLFVLIVLSVSNIGGGALFQAELTGLSDRCPG
jgi:hypothetical protein